MRRVLLCLAMFAALAVCFTGYAGAALSAKAIAYTASADVVPGGEGTNLTFIFNVTGKGSAKVSVTSVELADVEGSEIPCQLRRAQRGGSKR